MRTGKLPIINKRGARKVRRKKGLLMKLAIGELSKRKSREQKFLRSLRTLRLNFYFIS